jgi:hypothetical protein
MLNTVYAWFVAHYAVIMVSAYAVLKELALLDPSVKSNSIFEFVANFVTGKSGQPPIQ